MVRVTLTYSKGVLRITVSMKKPPKADNQRRFINR